MKGCNETVAEIRGMDEVEAMPECVEIQKYHEVGYHYDRERIVDIPIMVAEIVLENKEQVIEKVNYINSIFDVFNPEGKSILMDKLDPKRLFE